MATAVNPLCTSISYVHKYDDNVCEATCEPHAYPTSPPEPHCYPVPLTKDPTPEHQAPVSAVWLRCCSSPACASAGLCLLL